MRCGTTQQAAFFFNAICEDGWAEPFWQGKGALSSRLISTAIKSLICFSGKPFSRVLGD